VRYPATITRRDGSFVVAFRDCPGCEFEVSGGRSLVARASATLARWLSDRLLEGDLPPRPSKRFRLLHNQRLLLVPVEFPLSLQIELRWARAEAGLNQRQLSKLSGVRQPHIARAERPGGTPKLDTLARLADAMGLRVEATLAPRE
jgi:predicted RNase H-like HicB family nuclease/DNA-binding XRE family transcriptional regulator